MKKERIVFKSVIGYEKMYQVTNTGKVWSIKRKIFLKPCKDKNGYLYVQLRQKESDVGYKSCKLHRIVYEAFRGEIPTGWDIDHLDQNKENNNIKNLIALPHTEHLRRHKLGKPLTEEHKRKIREAKLNKKKGI